MKRIRWLYLLLLLLLLVIAALTAWDYVEVRRLDRELARIESRGEPTTIADFNSATTNHEETAASRYYRAAVALVHRESGPGRNQFNVRMSQARLSGDWPADLLSAMRQQLSDNEEALRFLDKAAVLEFDGFREYPPISAYALHNLLPVAELRTNILALEGRSDEAAQSLHSALRLQRTMGFSLRDRSVQGRGSIARRSDPFAVTSLTRQLSMLASRTRPTPKHLELLADGFAALDNDDLLLHDLLWLRATSRIDVDNPYWWRRRGGTGANAFKLGESILTSIEAPLYRPFALHRMNERLRDYSDVIAAQAGKTWPAKLDALAEHHRAPFDLAGHGQSVARELAQLRSARTIVAIEQYRRANAEQIPENWNALPHMQTALVDPFSGRPLRILVGGGRYVVYGLGPNRRDDGGMIDPEVPPPGPRTQPPADVGISVVLH
jgi:hypothetical protein